MKTKSNTTSKMNIIPTAITDEFDLRRSGVKAHFKLLKTHASGRRAYLRTEHDTGVTSYEVIKPIKHKSADGTITFTYPNNEQFGLNGAYISGDDIFRDEKIEYYLENGFEKSYNQYLREIKLSK